MKKAVYIFSGKKERLLIESLLLEGLNCDKEFSADKKYWEDKRSNLQKKLRKSAPEIVKNR